MPTFPLTLPTGTWFSRASFGPDTAVDFNQSLFSKVRQTYVWRGQVWRADLELPPLVGDVAAEWRAFLTALNGMEGTFLMGDPGYRQSRGAASGLPLVAGASQTGQSLAVDGFTPNIVGILRAGDYFGLGSGSSARLYKLIADASSNGSGAATLSFWPRLRTSPADNAALVIANPVTQFGLTGNVNPWDMTPGRTTPEHGIRLSVEERL